MIGKEDLQKHLDWLNDRGGQKLVMPGANLREADLYGANLSGANLSGAYLNRADLSEAYLREANLSGTILETDKPVKIGNVWYVLFDPRGWILSAHIGDDDDGQPVFIAGCQKFVGLDKALRHWGAADYADKERGQKYVEMCTALSEKLT